MFKLKVAVERLVSEAFTTESPSTVQPLAEAVLELCSGAASHEQAEAIATLCQALDPEYAEASGWLAITAGAIVEAGADPTPLADRLITLLPALIQKATEFGEFALTQALSPEQSEEVEDETDGVWLGSQFLPSQRAEEVADLKPDGADAWSALYFWCAPAVACLTRDDDARKRAVATLPPMARLAEINGDAHCLSVLLSVLDDEPFLVFHPATNQGYRLRVSGVADNFQLHTLLADSLIKPAGSSLLGRLRSSTDGLPGARPHALAAAVARGDGPQESDAPSQGVWNLYNWTAVQSDGCLPANVPSSHWVWGEGKPGDIECFEGFRVVLLGPPSYVRTWNTARFFPALRASVIIEETFSSGAVQEWLRRLGQATQQT
jgi:hypothetical protein